MRNGQNKQRMRNRGEAAEAVVTTRIAAVKIH